MRLPLNLSWRDGTDAAVLATCTQETEKILRVLSLTEYNSECILDLVLKVDKINILDI